MTIILNERWCLSESPIAKGGVANIFTAQDLQSDNQVIVKINTSEEIHQRELETMLAIKEKNLPGFSVLIDHGIAEEEQHCNDNTMEISKVFFIVMEQLGKNLSVIQVVHFPTGYSLKTVAQIGLQTLDAIESLHAQGIIHCDVKPDNLCGSEFDHVIRLIDFGLSKSWRDARGVHVPL